MKKNLMFSGFSLIFTLFLLICIVTAWYVTNEEASATGITGATDGDNYTLELERGAYDSETDSWTWFPTNVLTFANVTPGNKFFFRIKIDNDGDKTLSFNASFKNVTSELMEEFTLGEDNRLYLDSTPLYDVVDNKVTIASKTLYSYDTTSKEFSLVDYKIEDTFKFYNLGATEPDDNSLLDSQDNKLTGQLLKSISNYTFEVTPSNDINYQYFAIEFDESLTMVEINGIECSNAYLYQRLCIEYIEITKND